MVAVIVAVTFWPFRSEAPSSTSDAGVTAPVPRKADAAPASEGAAAPPARQIVPAAPTAAAGPQTVSDRLEALLGRNAVLSLLLTEDFPRRFVTTVDNLGRQHAPSAVWPVNPTAGKFMVDEHAGDPTIALDNSQRYTAFVVLAEQVDAARAVDLYVRLYPLLQRAYEDLGFPNRYFNDRLVEVIDQLLATPNAEYPQQLVLTEVRRPIPSVRPWVRYQFADPELESLSAGQKILLRAGPVNERRVKARLTALRAELTKRIAPR